MTPVFADSLDMIIQLVELSIRRCTDMYNKSETNNLHSSGRFECVQGLALILNAQLLLRPVLVIVGSIIGSLQGDANS